MRRMKVVWFGLSALLAAGCANGGALGTPCGVASDCASGMCIDENTEPNGYCSAACTAAVDCTVSVGESLRCDVLAGYCYRPCTFGLTRGTGATIELCEGGRYVACSSLPSTRCDTCGCEPFGGGTCVPSVGCVVPRADGEACAADHECTSGACYRDTNVCGPPRAMGEPCRVDAECTTRNCSTDGDTSTAGVCNQPLGSPCEVADRGAGRYPTPTCTQCNRAVFDGPAYCFRERCDLTTAPNCPSVGGHEFECARSTSGDHYCFERCETDFDSCYYITTACYRAGDFCR